MSTPAHGSRGLFGFLMAGALSLAAASCLGVLELDTYESATEQICSLYDRCYGSEAFEGCRRHVAGQIETADGEERSDFLNRFVDCLDDCQHVRDCLDQPLFCGALRENCTAGAQCCGFAAGLVACVGQSCCAVKDAACNRDANCCAGTCAGGKCQGSVGPVCAQSGATCSTNTDCCNGNCMGGICAVACSELGTACTSNGACCSNICVGNVCADQCIIRGGACAIDSECCSGKCSNGTCRKTGCFEAGALCLSDADCCEDSCDKGHGICGTAGCYGDGLPCSQDGDCCSGFVCNPADKHCAALACKKYNDSCMADAECCGLYCSGSCQCAPNGTTCTQAGAYKCCTGVCNNGTCADCRPGGTACSSGNQCCSGTCNNGSCCNAGCSHDLCVVGAALSTNDCSPKNVGAGAASCVSAICAQDPACCCNMWDQGCVDKVASVCKLVCP